MVTIRYTNKTQASFPQEEFFSTIRKSLKKYGLVDNVEVELQFVGKLAMQRLNRTYRGKDYATDVLSFPIWSNLATIKKQQGYIALGSIVVCLPVAKADATKEGLELNVKIRFLIEHSIQHLLGFHHEGDE